MITEIKVPPIESAGRLSVGRWFKRIGDPVSSDEPVAEIDTADGTCEIRATTTGVLTQVIAQDGRSVAPGAVIGLITEY